MKNHFRTIGLAFCITLAPMAALAQDNGQAGSGLGETATAPDGTTPDTSVNPFKGAAGADKFYQDNSLTGSPQPDNTATTGTGAMGGSSGLGSGLTGNLGSGNLGNSNPAPTLPAPEESSTADSANPFASAAGANKFYQDNSLTGSMPTTNLGSLGSLGSNAANWATTP